MRCFCSGVLVVVGVWLVGLRLFGCLWFGFGDFAAFAVCGFGFDLLLGVCFD